MGELVCLLTGKHLKTFVAEEIAGPLGADFQIGAREADWDRIAPVTPPPPLPFDLASLDPGSPVYKTFTGPVADAAAANTPGWRQADMGALRHEPAHGYVVESRHGPTVRARPHAVALDVSPPPAGAQCTAPCTAPCISPVHQSRAAVPCLTGADRTG